MTQFTKNYRGHFGADRANYFTDPIYSRLNFTFSGLDMFSATNGHGGTGRN